MHTQLYHMAVADRLRLERLKKKKRTSSGSVKLDISARAAASLGAEAYCAPIPPREITFVLGAAVGIAFAEAAAGTTRFPAANSASSHRCTMQQTTVASATNESAAGGT